MSYCVLVRRFSFLLLAIYFEAGIASDSDVLRAVVENPSELRERAIGFVRQTLTSEESQYRVVGMTERNVNLLSFGGSLTFTIAARPNEEDDPPIATVLVAADATAGPRAEIRVVLQRYVRGLVANRSIPANSMVNCLDFVRGFVKAGGQMRRPLGETCDPELERQRVRRTIPAGEALRVGDVARGLLISYGQAVRARVQAGAVVVDKAAVALEGASPGDVIRVRFEDATPVVSGRVQADGTVLLD